MFSPLLETRISSIIEQRIQALEREIPTWNIVTREEYLARLSSELNKILNLGNKMSPLRPVTKEGPAVVGDVVENLKLLNQDAAAVMSGLLEMESDAANLLNLYAASQNGLRQMVRERLFRPGKKVYTEQFISQERLEQSTASLFLDAGVCTLPLLSAKTVTPKSIDLGVSTDPKGKAVTALDYLTDLEEDTAFVFEGGRLEIVITFSKPEILNYLQIVLDEHTGLSVLEIMSTPDGMLQEDILGELPAAYTAINGSSGKYTGEYVACFNPKYVHKLKLVIEDRVGAGRIALRHLSCGLRRFSGVGIMTSKKILEPVGQLKFTCEQSTANLLTNIMHQYSLDGVNYRAMQPDEIIDVIRGPFWYRAYLERIDGNFETLSEPISAPGEDPVGATNYTVDKIQTVELGGGLIERSITFSEITGTVTLRETPNPGTLQCFESLSVVPSTEYLVNGSVVTFSAPRTGITVRYQTSMYTRSSLLARKEYYSPLLYSVQFEKV